MGNQLSLQSFICSSLDSEILMKPEYKVLIRIYIHALGQHAVQAVFYLCAGWGIRLVSGYLTDPMTSDEGKYFELANRETSREKYRCSSNMHYIPLSFPSVSHVYSSAELSLFNCKNTGALHLSDLSFWIPSNPQTQPWFLCDSLTIHQSRKDLHEQRVSGLHHPKGPSSVSHSLLILVQSNWVDWAPVLVWSMRQTESRLKMIGRGLWVRICCLTEGKKEQRQWEK